MQTAQGIPCAENPAHTLTSRHIDPLDKTRTLCRRCYRTALAAIQTAQGVVCAKNPRHKGTKRAWEHIDNVVDASLEGAAMPDEFYIQSKRSSPPITPPIPAQKDIDEDVLIQEVKLDPKEGISFEDGGGEGSSSFTRLQELFSGVEWQEIINDPS